MRFTHSLIMSHRRDSSPLLILTLLVACLHFGKTRGALNPNANPWIIRLDTPVGPDGLSYSLTLIVELVPADVVASGPWNAMSQAVDFPDQVCNFVGWFHLHAYPAGQNLTMLPSLTSTSVFVAASTCSNQNSACVQGSQTLWVDTPSHIAVSGWTNSNPVDFASSNPSLEPMRLQGRAVLTAERFTLKYLDLWTRSDDTAVSLAGNITVMYPGQRYYILTSSYVRFRIDKPPSEMRY